MLIEGFFCTNEESIFLCVCRCYIFQTLLLIKMPQFNEISFWTKKLGHLPVHLSPTVNDKYIMLNGISGNFCLHFAERVEERNTYFSQSWSSSTKNFLVVNGENIRLYNWHKEVKEENIAVKSVSDNIDKFYQYLLAKSNKSEKDVVPFVIDIFRKFRTYTSEAANPVQALNLLFVLLASLEDTNINALDREKWGISEYDIHRGFDSYIDSFRQGVGDMIPDLNLILRHSAGNIFQEAQKEVLFFDTQLDLFGTFSGAMITKDLSYSSIHYTPSYLARSIVENALRLIKLDELQEIRILDPACGSAEFLVEVLKQLKEKNFAGNVSIFGFDISDTAVNTSRFLLTYEKRTVWHEKLSFLIEKVEDSLTKHWDNHYDLILMNPPFVSWEQLNEKGKKDAVRDVLGGYFNGRPNQASAFFYKAISHLSDNGVLGSIIPTSVFSADYYQKLRREVEGMFTFELIGKLGNFVFEDALTDISIIVGRKPKDNTVPTLLWTRNEKGVVHDALRELRKMQYANESTKDRVDYSIFQPTQFPVIQNTWKPVSLKEYELIRNLRIHIIAGKLSTVDEIFDVQQGVRTGKNDVFKISAEDFLKLPIEERKYFRLVTDNDSINCGVLSMVNYIWFPYNKSGSIFSSDLELETKVNDFYHEKLLPNKESLEKRSGISKWWELTRPRNWQFEKNKKLISTEFGNSASFAIDINGDYVVERGYAWQPKKKFTKDDYYFYLALFSSPFFDQLLSIYSRRLLAAWDLSKKYTKEIPIPNVHVEELKAGGNYGKMVELGRRLSAGDSYVKAIINDIVSIYYPTNT